MFEDSILSLSLFFDRYAHLILSAVDYMYVGVVADSSRLDS